MKQTFYFTSYADQRILSQDTPQCPRRLFKQCSKTVSKFRAVSEHRAKYSSKFLLVKYVEKNAGEAYSNAGCYRWSGVAFIRLTADITSLVVFLVASIQACFLLKHAVWFGSTTPVDAWKERKRAMNSGIWYFENDQLESLSDRFKNSSRASYRLFSLLAIIIRWWPYWGRWHSWRHQSTS